MQKKVILFSCIVILVLTAVVYILIKNAKHTPNAESNTWYVDYDSRNGETLLVRGEKIDSIKDNINELINALNGSDKDPESFRTPEDRDPNDPPKIKLQKIEAGIVYVEIINSEYLTQRMGTSGAQDFLAVATYTLTECPNISKVNFIFDEGDHASPGIYTRRYFTAYYNVISGHAPRE
jgi:hypothetical protein